MGVTPPLLAATQLGFSHPGAARPIFAGLELALGAGEILTILGPNGVGKSTLLRCLAGLARPTAGSLRLGDAAPSALNDAARARRLAFMTQSEGESFNFTVLEVVLTGRAAHLGLFRQPGSDEATGAMAALARVGIASLASRQILALSGGERQMVRMARALVQQAPVLLLDEPTAHLDIANQRQVLDVLRGLVRDGLAVCMSSHDPNHALACGGQVLAMAPGGWWRIGPASDVVTPQIMGEVYGIPVTLLQMATGRTAALPDFGAPTSHAD